MRQGVQSASADVRRYHLQQEVPGGPKILARGAELDSRFLPPSVRVLLPILPRCYYIALPALPLHLDALGLP
jgi:hypothetical protein